MGTIHAVFRVELGGHTLQWTGIEQEPAQKRLDASPPTLQVGI